MRKKLIEVALPLEAINQASAREKLVRRGLPASMHLWWARRPLAACRAVLFASIIDDPDQPGVPEALLTRIDRLPAPEKRGPEWAKLPLAEQRRQKLFGFVEQLVQWENSNDERIIGTARELILAATGGNPPPVLDPFCGGGSIPLEAQRLGLGTHASDLNPVAVLITKALIEIPPKFAGRPPVNPEDRARGAGAAWKGAAGLAADVRYCGKWMRDEAERRIGHLYPKVRLPKEYGGGEATVIAWLWARTVKCPNPACGADMPLVRSFWLSTKPGKKAWVEPIVDRAAKTIRFEVWTGKGGPQDGTKQRGRSRCLFCAAGNISDSALRGQAKQHGLRNCLMAVVAEGTGGRVYVTPLADTDVLVDPPQTDWLEQALPDNARWFSPPGYGLVRYRDLFTSRQLAALTTFSDLVREARERVRGEAEQGGLTDDGVPLAEGGTGAQAYADAVATYLAFAVDKAADRNSSLCSWQVGYDRMRNTFGRQALPMVWDYVETNPFAGAGGDWFGCVTAIVEPLEDLNLAVKARCLQASATEACAPNGSVLVCTDPPYYDNIGYADLSDFFYVWLRRSCAAVYPELFRTLVTPKAEELIATPHRHGGDKQRAKVYFEQGLKQAFKVMHVSQQPAYPMALFYAFKQSENDDLEHGRADGHDQSGLISTGWETMLKGLLDADFVVSGTWPIRTELDNRPVAMGSNALASSIVLVCRPRPEAAPLATRREFLFALKQGLPDALRKLQHSNIAPVDLAQAAIGPGMAVFSRYAKVLEPDGKPMSVRTALGLINQALDEVLVEQEGEYDADTRWAVAWFQQVGMAEGAFGLAETLSKAKNTALNGLAEAGIVTAGAGKVRLLRRDELAADWDPTRDRRLTVWEVTQQMVRALEQRGESGAAELLAKVGGLGEVARDLAYRLYSTCERKGWAQEALAYNSLVVAWPEIARMAAQPREATPGRLF